MINIGLHIRVTSTLSHVAQKAIRLNLPFFQCFLTGARGKKIVISDNDKKQFLLIRDKFSAMYLHGSYWINLCNFRNSHVELISSELDVARNLSFTHVVVHPGSAKYCSNKEVGIESIARSLNILTKRHEGLTIVLENTAHGKMTIGSDLHDFALLLQKLDRPESVSFCLDTAHAYSYGYDLVCPTAQQGFLDLVDATIGLNRVALIHLNDTKEELGRRIDCHHAPGTGNIGDTALYRFISFSGLQNVPIILELPVMEEQDEFTVLQKVRQWKCEPMEL
ncbi:MAG: deoxyribonuclease IV [Candidatus Babeliales bacterium]